MKQQFWLFKNFNPIKPLQINLIDSFNVNRTRRIFNCIFGKIRKKQKHFVDWDILVQVRLMVTEGLCKDALFRKLYQDVLWTGSSCEGLSAPGEFFLNIILRLPVKQSELEVSWTNETSSVWRLTEALCAGVVRRCPSRPRGHQELSRRPTVVGGRKHPPMGGVQVSLQIPHRFTSGVAISL